MEKEKQQMEMGHCRWKDGPEKARGADCLENNGDPTGYEPIGREGVGKNCGSLTEGSHNSSNFGP